MNKETLQKANQLDQKIRDLEAASNCFEWKPDDHSAPISLNPQITIEYDGDGREQIKLPFRIQGNLLKVLQDHIELELNKAKAEFEDLK